MSRQRRDAAQPLYRPPCVRVLDEHPLIFRKTERRPILDRCVTTSQPCEPKVPFMHTSRQAVGMLSMLVTRTYGPP
jgi:hypothetical protein